MSGNGVRDIVRKHFVITKLGNLKDSDSDSDSDSDPDSDPDSDSDSAIVASSEKSKFSNFIISVFSFLLTLLISSFDLRFNDIKFEKFHLYL